MKNDYRNYLFESYIKVLTRYRPKAFIFENVPGILSAKPGDRYIIDIIKESFKNVGYVILGDLKEAIINCADYGVPQNRKRVIIFGLDKNRYGDSCDEIIKKFYDEILPKYKVLKKSTVRDAIGNLPKLLPLDHDIKYNGMKTRYALPEPFVENHVARWQSDRDIDIFKLLCDDIDSGENKYTSTEALKALYTEKTGKKSNVHKYHVLRWENLAI